MKNYVKTAREIETIAEGGKILGEILRKVALVARPGVSTGRLSEFAESEITRAGGAPSFIGYGDKKNPYPAGLCTSLNDVVVHGVPSRKEILKEGDIIGLDIGMKYKGLFTDTALTVGVGQISQTAQKLIKTTKLALEKAIVQAKAGNRIGDISHVIQRTAEAEGFQVVRDLVGHGVGYAVHEDPAVPCFGRLGTGEKLEAGMVLAIEPMVVAGSYEIYFDSDGWTIHTKDGGLAAHFEHTVAITANGSRVLT